MTMIRPILAFVLAFVVVGAANAQDPFGGDPFSVPPAAKQPPADDPFSGAAPPSGASAPLGASAPGESPAGAPATAAPTTTSPPRAEHPLLQALRETNPTTPSELMRAVQISLDLSEHDAAKAFLDQLRGLNLNAASLFALVREFGSSAFVRLVRTREVDPQGREFGMAALLAADAVARDPARLRNIAARVADPSPQIRRAAIRELQAAGPAAVAPLVTILANSIQAEIHHQVRTALVSLGRSAVAPLMGVLEAPDPALRAQAMTALGLLRANDAMELLLGPSVNPQADPAEREAAGHALERIVGQRAHPADARELLAQEIRELLDGKPLRQPDADGSLELWRWDATQTAAVPRRYPARAAAVIHAARLARDLYAISPQQIDDRRLYLEALLQAAKIQAGLHLPLPRGEGTAHAAAVALGVGAVEDALRHAMETGRIPAAIGAVEVLGDIGRSTQVHDGAPTPTPLVAALRHPNQRLRFAAAEAVAKIDPTAPFPDSHRYVDILARLVRTEALPRVLVGHPRGDVAQTLAGLLTQMGYEADAAYTGRQAYDLASRHPDYVFLLLSDSLDDPPVSQLVELLRQDFRTAALPIGVMYRIEVEPHRYTSDTPALMEAATQTGDRVPGLIYREDRMLAARELALLEPAVEAIPRPHDLAALNAAALRLLALSELGPVTPVERVAFAKMAIETLGRYAADPVKYSLYHIPQIQDSLVKAIDLPELALPAAHALGMLGTAMAQRTLVDVASEPSRPLELRQAAAAAFRKAVARQHLQLTTKEIHLQYQRYNLSERLDPATQMVLGHVLDTLEGVGEETPSLPPSDAQPASPSS